MSARWRALLGVILIVAMLGGVPGLMAPATAAPRVVTVSVAPLSPLVMKAGDEWTGFTVDLWEAIAKRQDWTTRWVEDTTPAAQLRSVAAGRAEIAASGLSITSARTVTFDFSQPYLDSGLQIMVPARAASDTSPGVVDFLRLLFSRTMLTFLLVALIVTVIPAHVLWLIERRHADPAVSRSYFPGIIQAYGWGLGSLAAQGDTSPRHWVGRSIAILWAFVAIIFGAFYTANLTTDLTVERLDTQIKGPADLYGKSVCTVADTTPAEYLHEMNVPATGTSSIDGCYDGLRDGRFEAVVFDAPVLRYFIAHAGAGVANVTGPVFDDEYYGFAMMQGNPLRLPINQSLLEIREDGTYELIYQKWFGDDASTGSDSPG